MSLTRHLIRNFPGEINCLVDSNPLPNKIHWFKNGSIINQDITPLFKHPYIDTPLSYIYKHSENPFYNLNNDNSLNPLEFNSSLHSTHSNQQNYLTPPSYLSVLIHPNNTSQSTPSFYRSHLLPYQTNASIPRVVTSIPYLSSSSFIPSPPSSSLSSSSISQKLSSSSISLSSNSSSSTSYYSTSPSSSLRSSSLSSSSPTLSSSSSSSSPRISFNISSLSIRFAEVLDADVGLYACQVFNSEGKSDISQELIIIVSGWHFSKLMFKNSI